LTLAIEAPGSIGEALELLAAEPTRLVIAGGTDVVPALNAGRLLPRPMLALGRVREISGAGRTADGGLFLGARLTLAQLRTLGAVLPALARAAAVGPPGVRTAATVGGNVVSAAGGDLLPLLVVLDAHVQMDSVGGRRSVPIAEFLASSGRADRPRLRPGELVVGVWIPTLNVDAQVERLVLPGSGSRAALALAAARDPGDAWIRIAVQVGDGLPVRAVAAAAEIVDAVGPLVEGDPYLRHAATVCARRMVEAR
jgi:CO/xanthine dehydrogenase FAD-binding subunit